MSESQITVYGTKWCFDCRLATQFLDENNVSYRWIDIETSRDGADIVLRINDGLRSVPTIVFPDGSSLTEPTRAELAARLDLDT